MTTQLVIGWEEAYWAQEAELEAAYEAGAVSWYDYTKELEAIRIAYLEERRIRNNV